MAILSEKELQEIERDYMFLSSKDIFALVASLREAKAALAETISFAEEGWSYASDYFKDKWNFEERLEKYRRIVEASSDE